MGRGSGLCCLPPRTVHSYGWGIAIHPVNSYRPFKDRYAKVGWSLTGRTYFLGSIQNRSVFIVFRPCHPDHPAFEEEENKGPTSLNSKRMSRFELFMASAFSQISHGGIHCTNLYADVQSARDLPPFTNIRWVCIPPHLATLLTAM